MNGLRRQHEWDHVAQPRVQRGLELGLQPSHLRVLNAISHGLTEEEAAVVLGETRDSVKTHMREARRALAAKNQAHAIARALRFGLIA